MPETVVMTASSTSTAVAILEPIPIPTKKYKTRITSSEYQWEELLRTQHYNIDRQEHESFQQIEIIQEFALKLLQNCKEMDSEIAKVVNENFWDLL